MYSRRVELKTKEEIETALDQIRRNTMIETSELNTAQLRGQHAALEWVLEEKEEEGDSDLKNSKEEVKDE